MYTKKKKIHKNHPLPFNKTCIFYNGQNSLTIQTCTKYNNTNQQNNTSNHSIDVPINIQNNQCLVLQKYEKPKQHNNKNNNLFIEIHLYKNK